jgi:squalene monooxygenase
MEREPDAVIVGAGIIGCSLAVTLAKQGRSVVLIERDWAEPDRIVGELLQPGGVKALTKLGLRDCLDGIDAIPEYGYQVIYKDERVLIPYVEEDKGLKEGRSFHHGRFINNLRNAVKKDTRITRVEGTVKSVVKNELTGQVLGVQYARKGCDYREYVSLRLPI